MAAILEIGSSLPYPGGGAGEIRIEISKHQAVCWFLKREANAAL
jgi:hypothetical protein